MGEQSSIQWTHHTFNPWIGCAKVSPGCKNCYAETETYPRVSRARGLELWGVDAHRHVTSDAYWRKPLTWDRAAAKAGERHRVFCASMADVFEDRPELGAPRARLWRLIFDTPHLDWLLLTKRPENAARLALAAAMVDNDASSWPKNIWLGTTVESQKAADERIPHLRGIPAAVRFLSCEPLLEPVDVSRGMWPTHWQWAAGYKSPEEAIAAGAFAEKHRQALVSSSALFVDWVIIGGESGPRARPFDVAWARAIVQQCREAGVAPFVKQLGKFAVSDLDVTGNFRTHPMTGKRQLEMTYRPLSLRDAHGGDIAEWPEDLRVREFPRA